MSLFRFSSMRYRDRVQLQSYDMNKWVEAGGEVTGASCSSSRLQIVRQRLVAEKHLNILIDEILTIWFVEFKPSRLN